MPTDSSDISSSGDEDDFSQYKSPGGAKKFNESQDGPETPKAPYTPKSRDHYDVTTCDLDSVQVLITKIVTPTEPCQLINAEAYKNLVLELTPGIEPFRNSEEYVSELTVYVLKGTKIYCKSQYAKEVLAGFKLLELLAAQLGKPFFQQLCCTRWADRIFDIWEDTREPIHKLTIAQLIADWIYTFDNRVTVLPFRIIGQKMPLPPATQDARNRREAWENRASGGKSNSSAPEPESPKQKSSKSKSRSPKSSKPKPGSDSDQEEEKAPTPKSPKKEKPKKKEEPKKEEPPAREKGTGTLSEQLHDFFDRYDYDKSGTINNSDEMQQLCTNIIFKLKIMIAPDDADKRIGSAGDQESFSADPWPFEKFEEWFRENFKKVTATLILMTRCCSLQHISIPALCT